ncbi:unnamed protein product, partial [Amoebophrya sp. A25]
ITERIALLQQEGAVCQEEYNNVVSQVQQLEALGGNLTHDQAMLGEQLVQRGQQLEQHMGLLLQEITNMEQLAGKLQQPEVQAGAKG